MVFYIVFISPTNSRIYILNTSKDAGGTTYCVYFVVIAVRPFTVEKPVSNFLYIITTECNKLINFAHSSISSLLY